MENTILSLANEDFIIFTFKGITTNINSKGEEKKIPIGMPQWKTITKDNFYEYCKTGDKGAALITGEISGITVIDFDDINEYNTMIKEYPELKQHRTIRTNKGVHLYCKYDKNFKTTTNAMNIYSKVDIRNDDGIVFCPPTKYTLKNGVECLYIDEGGDILPIPEIIRKNMKNTSFVNFTETPNNIEEKVIEEKVIKEKVIENKENKKNTEVADLKFIKESIEAGYLDLKNNSYDDWRDIGFIINHTSKTEEAFKLFDLFSQKNKEKYDKLYTRQFWNTIKQTSKKPLTIGTLIKWVNEYKQENNIVDKHSTYRFAKNDEEASNMIVNDVKKLLISYKGRLFFYNNHIWIHDKMKIDDFLLTFIMSSKIFKQTELGIFPYVQNVNSAKQVREAVYSKIRTYNDDPHLYQKFHTTTKNRLCFEDGVLDLSEKKFYKWDEINFEYYSCLKIERSFGDYFNNPNLDIIKEIETNIFENMYGSKKEIALHFLSRAIAGQHEDKNWATYVGNRDCGKGVQYEILESGFEEYVRTFELGNIMYNRKTSGLENTDCSKKLYWLIDLEFARLAISQETPDHKSDLKCNSKMLKKMSGGNDTIVARRNYDRVDTHFKIDTTFYIMGNNSLQVDNEDCKEHCIDFNSVNQFKTEGEINKMRNDGISELEIQRYKIKDNSIKDKCKTVEWKNAIVYLLLQNYKDYPVPIEKADFEEDESLLSKIKEKYEFTYNVKEDIITCAEVNESLTEYDKQKIQNELLSINIFKKKYQKNDKKKDKWCYFGLKLKVEEIVEE